MEFIKALWPHQERGLNEAIEHHKKGGQGYGLFFEPRCGKTATAINVFRYLCGEQRRRLKTLIFAPPRVVGHWKNEFAHHSRVTPESIVLLQGPHKRRLHDFQVHQAAGGFISVTNYESLLMPELFSEFTRYRPEVLIFDESHRVKDSKAKRSKLAERLANPRENRPYTLILTGSPVLNSLEDLYQQFKILDGGQTFSYYDYRSGKQEPLSKRGFMHQYFIDRNAGMPQDKHFPKWELRTARDGRDSMKEISALIAHSSMRVERKDCLTLPPNDQVTIEVELSPEQKKLYSEMKSEFITWYKSQPVVAKMALTKTLRLLQITSGFVKTEEGKELYLETIPKQNALRELLEDLLPSGKCLVWSVFKENYRQIRSVCDSLGVAYVEVHGEIGSAQQDRNVKSFQSDPGVRVFIGHPESGGEGINLVQAPFNIFYSRTHSLKHSIQASARNQSQDSQHLRTVRYDIVARATLDQLVAEIVVQKEKMTEAAYAELVLKNLLHSGRKMVE